MDPQMKGMDQTCLSDLYATAAILWSKLSMHSGEGVSSPVSPKTSYSHICSRSAPSMSVNVGVTFAVYHGRSRSTWEPSWPFRQYHRTVSDPMNHAIGCARSTLRALHTRGSCNPRCCLLSKNASFTLHRRQ